MNGAIKFHKPTGPAFHAGEMWVSYNNIKVVVKGVRKYTGVDGTEISDYAVIYDNGEGVETEKDAWSFQVRYTHAADLEATK